MDFQIQITGPRGSGKTSYIQKMCGISNKIPFNVVSSCVTLSLSPDKNSFNYVSNDIKNYLSTISKNKKALANSLFTRNRRRLQHMATDVREFLISLFQDKKQLSQLLHTDQVTFNLIENRATGWSKGHIIIMDVTDMFGLENTERYITTLQRRYEKEPIIVCGNKIDSEDRIIFIEQISNMMKKYPRVLYYEISVENEYQLDRPLLMLAQIICDPKYKYYQIFNKTDDHEIQTGLSISSTIHKSPIIKV